MTGGEIRYLNMLQRVKGKMNEPVNGNAATPHMLGYLCSNCKADPMELTTVFGQVMSTAPDGSPGATLITCAVACKACRVLVTILPFQLIVPEKRVLLV